MVKDRRPRSTIHSVFSINEDVVTASTTFASARTRYLYRWWSGIGAKPTMNAFVLDQHPLIAANIFMVERIDGEWRFGHYGAQTKQLLDSDPTGHWVKTYSVERYSLPLDEYYDAVIRLGECVKCFGMLSILGRKDVMFESIDCPMLDEAGEPRFILGVLDAVAWEGSTP